MRARVCVCARARARAGGLAAAYSRTCAAEGRGDVPGMYPPLHRALGIGRRFPPTTQPAVDRATRPASPGGSTASGRRGSTPGGRRGCASAEAAGYQSRGERNGAVGDWRVAPAPDKSRRGGRGGRGDLMKTRYAGNRTRSAKAPVTSAGQITAAGELCQRKHHPLRNNPCSSSALTELSLVS